MPLDPATGQHPATSGLDIDDRVHNNPLTERFGDLLVRLPDDPGAGDRLKLDKGGTTTLKCSLKQPESSPLDDTPPLGLNLHGDIGNAPNASQSLVKSPASENCSCGSLDCGYAWRDIRMLLPCLL